MHNCEVEGRLSHDRHYISKQSNRDRHFRKPQQMTSLVSKPVFIATIQTIEFYNFILLSVLTVIEVVFCLIVSSLLLFYTAIYKESWVERFDTSSEEKKYSLKSKQQDN